MGQPYTSGVWIAKPGREEEFVAAWREFAEWTSATGAGRGWAKLLRDREQPTRFVSLGRWDSSEDEEAYRSHPGFAERLSHVRELVDHLERSTLDEVAGVGEPR